MMTSAPPFPTGRGAIFCTLGFNAREGTDRLFVTAAHCTTTQGGNQQTLFAQPNARTSLNRYISRERKDPPFFDHGAVAACPVIFRCRYSDAASVRYNRSTQSDLGCIARTTGADNGSTDIDLANPFFTIVADAPGALAGGGTGTQGDQLNYVGQVSGWVTGRIRRTCAVIALRELPDVLLLCQTVVNARSAPGNSGAPVFSAGAGGVTLYGVLWGSRQVQEKDGTLTDVYDFSPIVNIRHELGALVTH